MKCQTCFMTQMGRGDNGGIMDRREESKKAVGEAEKCVWESICVCVCVCVCVCECVCIRRRGNPKAAWLFISRLERERETQGGERFFSLLCPPVVLCWCWETVASLLKLNNKINSVSLSFKKQRHIFWSAPLAVWNHLSLPYMCRVKYPGLVG